MSNGAKQKFKNRQNWKRGNQRRNETIMKKKGEILDYSAIYRVGRPPKKKWIVIAPMTGTQCQKHCHTQHTVLKKQCRKVCCCFLSIIKTLLAFFLTYYCCQCALALVNTLAINSQKNNGKRRQCVIGLFNIFVLKEENSVQQSQHFHRL